MRAYLSADRIKFTKLPPEAVDDLDAIVNAIASPVHISEDVTDHTITVKADPASLYILLYKLSQTFDIDVL